MDPIVMRIYGRELSNWPLFGLKDLNMPRYIQAKRSTGKSDRKRKQNMNHVSKAVKHNHRGSGR